MRQKTILEVDELSDFLKDFKADVCQITKSLRINLLEIDEPLKQIDKVYREIKDVKDAIHDIRQCLINKGFMEEKVLFD